MTGLRNPNHDQGAVAKEPCVESVGPGVSFRVDCLGFDEAEAYDKLQTFQLLSNYWEPKDQSLILCPELTQGSE